MADLKVIGKWILLALGIFLVGLMIYGAYQFYFRKPVPEMKTYTVMPGATMNVTEAHPTVKDDPISVFSELYVGASTQGAAEVGFRVGIRFD